METETRYLKKRLAILITRKENLIRAMSSTEADLRNVRRDLGKESIKEGVEADTEPPKGMCDK